MKKNVFAHPRVLFTCLVLFVGVTTIHQTQLVHHVEVMGGIRQLYHESTSTDDDPEEAPSISSTILDTTTSSASRLTHWFWSETNNQHLRPATSSTDGAIEAFGLSVNHLQVIPLASGALPEQVHSPEDFLPVVTNEEPIQLRFRLQARTGSMAQASREISAYQLIAVRAYRTQEELWNTGKVTASTMPDHIPWDIDSIALPAGTIVEWKVLIWDHEGHGPSMSAPSKFAMGPSSWEGEWIVHPTDRSLFSHYESAEFSGQTTDLGCEHWKRRRPLPLARTQVDLSTVEARDVVSAMLVVSGLGSFAVSIDGQALSSSSAMDPPLTEFSQRISYRGYDVTSFFAKAGQRHVIGVTLGSGWFDPRPLQGGIVKHNLFPRGPLTTVAELHLTMKNGTTRVVAPTKAGQRGWQMAKGFLLDSDLFTGDVTDLGRQEALAQWDTPDGWSESTMDDSNHDSTLRDSTNDTATITWVDVAPYSSNIHTKAWRDILEGRAVHQQDPTTSFNMAPLGKLVPIEAPPVMPVERIDVESQYDLGDGRWLLDFGKAISGIVRFDSGLPPSIKPKKYPRGHYHATTDDFITVVYGDSLQMETGDINLVLVAGMGLHDGGPRANRTEVPDDSGPCYPEDHGYTLLQRDVFITPHDRPEIFDTARQSSFTTHGFRFAEVCCTQTAPIDAHAVMYRTAFEEWGTFDSSHVTLNGAYELIRNAFNSNMMGVQSDCPHREKLQYGGDLMANSPAAMHLFDLGAFYNKIIHDWTDVQWSNGAYTESTPWHDLNDYAGVGNGAGETVWASLPSVLTVRHMQHYGELKLLADTLDHHVEWMEFLANKWDSIDWDTFDGLGDWLAINERDTYLTHHAFYMATARSVAYTANQLIDFRSDAKDIVDKSMELAKKLRDGLVSTYMGGESLFDGDRTPGADLGLYARIVPGEARCDVLRSWIARTGSGTTRTWPGAEEQLFFDHLKRPLLDQMIQGGLAERQEDGSFNSAYKQGYSTHEGILALRYSLMTMSDSGFHHVALNKVTGKSMPSVEYMLSHNATTMWETWWRSEDVYSRNHPMLGAIAEWLSAAVAGIALSPRTTGGKELLFWPRIPTTSIVSYASATQGTKRGEAAIAWKFEHGNMGGDLHTPSLVKVVIRILIPPSSTGILRLPTEGIQGGGEVSMLNATIMPNLVKAKENAKLRCHESRHEKKGFSYNWEYDKNEKLWDTRQNSKAIGTPCDSFLFDMEVDTDTNWSTTPQPLKSTYSSKIDELNDHPEVFLAGGLYEVTITDWKLDATPAVLESDYYPLEVGAFCNEPATFEWDILDASYII